MRGHPLAGRLAPHLGGILAMLLVVACVSGAPVATPSAPAAVAVTVTSAPGETTAFAPAETVVREAGPISLTFHNASSLAHNLTFTDGVTAATRTIVEPGTSDHVALASLRPGAYRFVCTIHDGMAGTLVVDATGYAGLRSFPLVSTP